MELSTPILTLCALYLVGLPVRALGLRVGVPAAVSLMALGAVAGSSAIGLLPETTSVAGASLDTFNWHSLRMVLSQGAFVVLLLRAGFALPPVGLRAVVLPGLVFGTLPVAVEVLAVSGLSRAFLFGRADMALLCGFLIAAVSPAVVLPIMLELKDRGRGTRRLVPDRIMAQTLVNVFIAQNGILIMTDVLCPPAGGADTLRTLSLLPFSLLGGLLVGSTTGWLLRIDGLVLGPSEPSKRNVYGAALIALAGAAAVYFGCRSLSLENVFATLAVGVVLRRRLDAVEPALRTALKRFWQVAEIVLFVNLGSQVDLGRLSDPTLIALLIGILAVALALRTVLAGALSLKTVLTGDERRYTVVANLPKATVQAVFGAYPLTIFLARCPDDIALIDNGYLLLIFAVVAIVATTPIGAVLLDRLGSRWLRAQEPDSAHPASQP